LARLGVLASRGDPVDAMELAIQRLAADHLQGSEHLHPDWPLEREYPLQADLLVVSRLWRGGQGQDRLAAKGAPEAIADRCHLEPEASRRLLEAADRLAAEGLRVLAVARGLEGIPRHGGTEASGDPPADPHDFLFAPVGFLGLADPLRPDVPQAIATAHRAGVRVVMITGDGPLTARAIADQAGLPPGQVLCGADLPALAGGAVVAMTGDGVNDAAALKAADIGVAMGRRVDANLQRALAYTLAIHQPIALLALPWDWGCGCSCFRCPPCARPCSWLPIPCVAVGAGGGYRGGLGGGLPGAGGWVRPQKPAARRFLSAHRAHR
jgi:Ca2+-transporting ATPase